MLISDQYGLEPEFAEESAAVEMARAQTLRLMGIDSDGIFDIGIDRYPGCQGRRRKISLDEESRCRTDGGWCSVHGRERPRDVLLTTI